MKILTRNETADFLLKQDHFCILSHRRPDGDTLGSTAALCLGLRSLGKTAHVLRNPEITERFQWLHEGLTKEAAEEGDTIVTVDVASPGMLPLAFQHLLGKIDLRIDHHSAATSFTECELVDGDSASCAEVVWDVLKWMGVRADRAISEATYVGLSTDTGCFRYSNTTDHTFSVAAECARGGARIYELNQELFETNTLGRLKMQAWIVDHMKLLKGGEMAIVAIPKAKELEIGVTEDDMENISGFPRTIDGVKIAATIRQEGENKVKISVRAVPGYDAAAICAKFGGGGHKGAAGASIACSMDEAVEALKKAIPELN